MWPYPVVKKTTLYLDEATRIGVRELAQVQGRKQSALIREAIAVYLDGYERPMAKGIGAYRSGRPDIGERSEEFLAERPRPGA